MKLAIALLLSAIGFLTVHPSLAGDLPATNTGSPESPTTKYKIDKRGGGRVVTTTGKLQVLSAPKAGSPVLDEYDKAMMVVIGDATGTGYVYVSPCNACQSGFVSKTELQAKTKR